MSASKPIAILPFLVSFLCLVSGVAALHVKTKPCTGDTVEAAKVNFIDISPCETDPCQLTNHNTYQLSISFETGPSPATIKAATARFYAIIFEGIKVIWPNFTRTDACKDSGLSCPLEPNHSYLYSIPMYINSPFDITLPVEAEIVDDATKKDLLCQVVAVKVVG